MKPIYVSITRSGDISKAIRTLKEYQSSLVDKGEIFVQRLAELGASAAKMTLASRGHGDSSRSALFSISFNVEGENVEGTLSITSEPNVTSDGRVFYPHLAWEFGAGIHYNNGNANPNATKMGMGVGTFPEQKNALNDYWWYRDKSGNLHLSQGTQATMPMYNASIEMIQSIERIAREVYGNG